MSHLFQVGECEGSDGERLRRTIDAWKQAAADPLISGAIAALGLAVGFQLAGKSRTARIFRFLAPSLLLLDLFRYVSRSQNGKVWSRRPATDGHLEERFEGGCAAPPMEWEEAVDPGFRMTAARDPDDYSERISRVAPLKAK